MPLLVNTGIKLILCTTETIQGASLASAVSAPERPLRCCIAALPTLTAFTNKMQRINNLVRMFLLQSPVINLSNKFFWSLQPGRTPLSVQKVLGSYCSRLADEFLGITRVEPVI